MQPRKVGPVVVALAAAATAVLLVAASGNGSRPPPLRTDQAAGWRGLVGSLRREIPLGQRMLVLLNAPSLADKVAAAGGLATDDQERKWSAEAAAAQQQLLFGLIGKGLRVNPDYRYTRVLNGFSAALDAGAGAGGTRCLPRSRGLPGVHLPHPASRRGRPAWNPFGASGCGGRLRRPGRDGCAARHGSRS